MGKWKLRHLNFRDILHTPVRVASPLVFHPQIMQSSRMTASELAHSAANDASPPAGTSPIAQTLWLARAGQWDAAHDLCQNLPGIAGSWIHAYLHREEGDDSNAAYWYSCAGKGMPASSISIAQEWMQIAEALLGSNDS